MAIDIIATIVLLPIAFILAIVVILFTLSAIFPDVAEIINERLYERIKNSKWLLKKEED